MADLERLSAKSIAADCYRLLAIPEARATILGLARKAHDLDTSDEETQPLIDRPLDRSHPEECAAWCVALVRYFHRDWEHFPQLYEPTEEIGTGPLESARVSVAVLDSYLDDWLSALVGPRRQEAKVEHAGNLASSLVEATIVEHEGEAESPVAHDWRLPSRLRKNANAILSVLRARVDEWGSLFEIALELPQTNVQANDTRGQCSTANMDEGLGDIISGVTKHLQHAASKLTAVQRVDGLMNQMLREDPMRVEWTLLNWVENLKVGKATILQTDAWETIKRNREAQKEHAQSRAEVSGSAFRAKQGKRASASKPKG